MVDFCYEMLDFMHYFSDILQSETLIQLQINLENSQLTV